MFAVKRLGSVERPFGGKPPVRDAIAAQSWEWSERRRLISLLSAGWLPPSVSTSRGFPRSRGRASGQGPATYLATGVPHLRAPLAVLRSEIGSCLRGESFPSDRTKESGDLA